MRWVFVAIVTATVACGGSSKQAAEPGGGNTSQPAVNDPPAPDPGKQVLAEVRGMATEMCDCKDYGCAAKIARIFAIWLKDASKRYEQAVLDANTKQFMARFEQLRVCHNKLAPVAKRMKDPKATGDNEAAKMDGFATAMCACPDKGCAETTLKRMLAWLNKHFKGGQKKGTKRSVERYKAAQKKLNACFIERMQKGSTTAKQPPPPPSAAELAQERAAANTLEGFARDVCACTNRKCAIAARTKMTTWISTYFRAGKQPPRDDQNIKRWTVAAQQFNECLRKLVPPGKGPAKP